MAYYLGVDIGGTNIKFALVDDEGAIHHKWHLSTAYITGSQIVGDIITSIREKLHALQCQAQVGGLGVGAPGFVDASNGVVFDAVNLGWRQIPLKEVLERELELPAHVDNDANLAALGEMWQGAGQGVKDLFLVTLGTGVGGAIISDGRLIHGVDGMGGEIGHMIVKPQGGYPCNCGVRGCLETIASATGIVRTAQQKMEEAVSTWGFRSKLIDVTKHKGKLAAEDVFAAAANEDPVAIEVINEVTFYLGLALINVATVVSPRVILIGGGVSQAGEQLLKPLRASFEAYVLPRVRENVRLDIAALGNDAGIIGGAWLAKSRGQRP